MKGIDLIRFSYESTAPNQNKISQGFTIGYSGLNFKDTAQNTALVPQQFKTSISLKNFPFVDVINFAEETVGDTKDPSAKQVAAAKAMSFLPQKLKDAGTSLMLKNTSFGNASYNVVMDGILKAEPASQIGGVGTLNIEATGLDAVMTELQKTPGAAGLAQPLTMFRLISEQKGDKNIAKIELNAQGNVSVNGKDMSALMGGGAPAQ